MSQRWEQVGSLTLKGTDALTVQSKAGYSLTFFIRPVEDLERREKKGPGFKVKVEDHCTAPLQCYYDICDCPTESRPFVQLLGEIQRGWFAGQPLFETDRWTRAGDFIEFQLPASFLPKGDLALWPGYHAEAVVNGVKVLPAPGLYRYVRIVRE